MPVFLSLFLIMRFLASCPTRDMVLQNIWLNPLIQACITLYNNTFNIIQPYSTIIPLQICSAYPPTPAAFMQRSMFARWTADGFITHPSRRFFHLSSGGTSWAWGGLLGIRALASAPAKAKGVFPYQSMALQSAPAAMRRAVHSGEFFHAATCKGVHPSRPGCDTSGSALAFRRSSVQATSLLSQARCKGV